MLLLYLIFWNCPFLKDFGILGEALGTQVHVLRFLYLIPLFLFLLLPLPLLSLQYPMLPP
jgi:hypothetical protein